VRAGDAASEAPAYSQKVAVTSIFGTPTVIGEPMMAVTPGSAIVLLLETDHAQAATLKDQHVHAIEKPSPGYARPRDVPCDQLSLRTSTDASTACNRPERRSSRSARVSA
jgi:hypothetical protein